METKTDLKWTHHLKIQEDYADAVLSGEKAFELRYNDRNYRKGDLIKFRVINENQCDVPEHRLNGKEYEITYTLGGWGLKPNYLALGIKPHRAEQDKEISQEETLDWLLRLVSSLDMLRVPQEWLEPIRKAIGTAIESVNISAELNKFMRGLWEEHCIEDITYTSGEFFDTITQEVYQEAKKTNETN